MDNNLDAPKGGEMMSRGIAKGLLLVSLWGVFAEREGRGAVERVGQSPSRASAVITFAEIGPSGRLSNYLRPNPVYRFQNLEGLGDIQVSFGSLFVGQQAGPMLNSLSDTSPSAPLRLDPTAPAVGVLLDSWAGDKLVLGGIDVSGRRYNTTPLAVLFSTPVSWVGFDVGSLDHDGTTLVEAYDSQGNSLGAWRNQEVAGGVERITLHDSTGARSIAGVSVYVPADGMDWEGFALDNLSFGVAPDPNVVPEPATWVVWAVLAIGGWVTQIWSRRATA